jgi:O-antigen ligase
VAPVHERPEYRNPHNPFLRILFHQGVAGLIPYILLLVVATENFWKGAYTANADEFIRYVLMACTSVMIGNYFVNAILINSELTDVTFMLGIGLAATHSGVENSFSRHVKKPR